jgi:membrane associated rhomboid family serine protease
MTLIILIVTLAVSALAFSNRQLFERLSLKPTLVYHKLQVYRILSHSLIHADWTHLLVNLFVLYSFGDFCEQYFGYYFGASSKLIFLLLYLLSLIASSLYSIYKYKNNAYYSAVGASGAVMAVVFASIFFDPWNKLYFFGVIPIPGILFGALYLWYSYYMGRRNADNIGHDAHFTGAVFGFIFPALIKPALIGEFLAKLLHP